MLVRGRPVPCRLALAQRVACGPCLSLFFCLEKAYISSLKPSFAMLSTLLLAAIAVPCPWYAPTIWKPFPSALWCSAARIWTGLRPPMCFIDAPTRRSRTTRNVARMSALLAGLRLEVPGATINHLCGSGLDAVGSATRHQGGRSWTGDCRQHGNHELRSVRHVQSRGGLQPCQCGLRHRPGLGKSCKTFLHVW